ncbi:hypothetical protein FDU21_00545 [Xanthomonas oryzae pv. oryzae]|nr:hypothetical protein FDU21_00545 [Xanthomonas oryzae pv. oryzae]
MQSAVSRWWSRTAVPIDVENLRRAARQHGSKSFHGNQLLARAALKSLSGKVFCSVRQAHAPAHSRNA